MMRSPASLAIFLTMMLCHTASGSSTLTFDFDRDDKDVSGFLLDQFKGTEDSPTNQVLGDSSTSMWGKDDASGGLRMRLYDADDVSTGNTGRVSGGWRIGFDLPHDGDVQIRVDYEAEFDACFGSGDRGWVYLKIRGTGAPREIDSFQGSNVGHRGWQTSSTVRYKKGLSAGRHTIKLGALLDYDDTTNNSYACSHSSAGKGKGKGSYRRLPEWSANRFQVQFDNLEVTVL